MTDRRRRGRRPRGHRGRRRDGADPEPAAETREQDTAGGVRAGRVPCGRDSVRRVAGRDDRSVKAGSTRPSERRGTADRRSGTPVFHRQPGIPSRPEPVVLSERRARATPRARSADGVRPDGRPGRSATSLGDKRTASDAPISSNTLSVTGRLWRISSSPGQGWSGRRVRDNDFGRGSVAAPPQAALRYNTR